MRLHALVDDLRPVSCFAGELPYGLLPSKVRYFTALLVRRGKTNVYGGFGSRQIESRDLMLIRPETTFGLLAPEPIECSILCFDPTFVTDHLRWSQPPAPRDQRATLRNLLESLRVPKVVHLPPRDASLLDEEIRVLEMSNSQPAHIGQHLRASSSLIWQICLIVNRLELVSSGGYQADARPTPLRDEIRAALSRMIAEHAMELRISELAREVCMSESAFRRAFRAATGVPPRNYLHDLRLNSFEELVTSTTLPLTQAARLAGWSSPAHARSAFLRRHGVPPSQFRNGLKGTREHHLTEEPDPPNHPRCPRADTQ